VAEVWLKTTLKWDYCPVGDGELQITAEMLVKRAMSEWGRRAKSGGRSHFPDLA
jgi:hypothetical protein